MKKFTSFALATTLALSTALSASQIHIGYGHESNDEPYYVAEVEPMKETNKIVSFNAPLDKMASAFYNVVDDTGAGKGTSSFVSVNSWNINTNQGSEIAQKAVDDLKQCRIFFPETDLGGNVRTC